MGDKAREARCDAEHEAECTRRRHSCCKPVASITSSSGSMIAAACGTGTASAISGVASAPKPVAKPLLDRPISSTAGMAAA